MNSFKLFLCLVYFISVYPNVKCKICCSNRDSVLNGTDLDSSRLILSMRTAIQRGDRNMSYNFPYSSLYETQLNNLIDTKLKSIIENTSITNDQKHNRIVDELLQFMSGAFESATNKTRTICIPINNFGYLGDYVECEVNDTKIDTKHPNYELQCSKYFPERPYWYIDGPSCYKPYCCDNINTLLNVDKPIDSILVSSFYKVFQRPNTYTYPFMFSSKTQSNWTDIMTTHWIPIIQNTTRNSYIKHKEIYAKSVKFITDYDLNLSVILCTPLDDWGYFGDYLQCVADDFKLIPPKTLECAAQFGWTQTWMMKEKPCFRNETKVEPVDACCSNRRYLLNRKDPYQSILIKSFETAIGWNKQNETYPYYWSYDDAEEWKQMMWKKWTAIIKDKTTTYTEKYKKIYDESIMLVNKIYYNKSRASCVLIGDWGYFGDFMQCAVNIDSATAPEYNLRCSSWFGAKQNWMRAAVPCKKNYCCKKVKDQFDFGTAKDSKTIKAIEDSYVSATYPFKSKWTSPFKKIWDNEIKKWVDDIESTQLGQNANTIKKIFESTYTYLKKRFTQNFSYILCVPIEGFGHFGDLLQCLFDEHNPNKEPEVMLTCPEYVHGQLDWLQPPAPCPVTTTAPACCDVKATFDEATVTDPTDFCVKAFEYKCKATGADKSCFAIGFETGDAVEKCLDGEVTIDTQCDGNITKYDGRVVKSIRCVAEKACCDAKSIVQFGDVTPIYPPATDRCLETVKISCPSKDVWANMVDDQDRYVTANTATCKKGTIGDGRGAVAKKVKCGLLHD